VTTTTAVICQRWAPGGKVVWVPPQRDYNFNPARYRVEVLDDDKRPKAFVEAHHYSAAYVAAIHRYGLFERATGLLVGVAVLSNPANVLVLTNAFPRLAPYSQSLELGRFVLTDEVPYRAESWFAGKVRQLAAEDGIRGIIAHADPAHGHFGTIYQASNARYCDMTGKRGEWHLPPDGFVFSDRAASKVRAQEKGHVYAEKQLTDRRATALLPGEDPEVWLAGALTACEAVRVQSDGKHRYLWATGTDKRQRAAVVFGYRARPYPKADLGQRTLF
jgi:hypothetical protein